MSPGRQTYCSTKTSDWYLELHLGQNCGVESNSHNFILATTKTKTLFPVPYLRLLWAVLAEVHKRGQELGVSWLFSNENFNLTANAVLRIQCAFHIIVIYFNCYKKPLLKDKNPTNSYSFTAEHQTHHLMVFSLAQIYVLFNIITLLILQSCPPTNK